MRGAFLGKWRLVAPALATFISVLVGSMWLVVSASVAGATGPVVVSGVSPGVGAAGGGISVVITGSDFIGATGVTFGSTPASSFVVNSDTQITAVSPQSEAGIVDIQVVGPDGTSAANPLGDEYAVIPQPPNPPLNVAAVNTGPRAVEVSWSPPSFDGGSPISNYYVVPRRNRVLSTFVTPATACQGTQGCSVVIPSGLSVGSISFSVVAINLAGGSSTAISDPVDVFAAPHVRLWHPVQQSIVPQQVVDVPVLASDNDDSPLTYSATNLPPGLSIDPETGDISGTFTGLPVDRPQSTTSVIAVKDGFGAENDANLLWVQLSALKLDKISRQSTFEGVPVTIPVVAADLSNGAAQTFSATGLPAGISIDPTTGLISGAGTDHRGFLVQVTDTDSNGSVSIARFLWQMKNPISLTRSTRQTSAINQPVSLPIEASDLSGASLTYGAANLPTGLSINPSSGIIAVTPTQRGFSRVVLTVTNSNNISVSATFYWKVH